MKVTKTMENVKHVGIRFPYEYWVYLKKKSITEEISINEFVLDCVEKDMKKNEKRIDTEKLYGSMNP